MDPPIHTQKTTVYKKKYYITTVVKNPELKILKIAKRRKRSTKAIMSFKRLLYCW